MNSIVYAKSPIQPDHYADRWTHVQHHIRGLHSFISGATQTTTTRRPTSLEETAAALRVPDRGALTDNDLAIKRRQLLDHYLDAVIEQSSNITLPLPDSNDSYQLPLSLESAYLTLRLARSSAGDAPLSVFAGLRQHRHLIMIGPDGAGKSTTVNYLAATMAQAIREPGQPGALQRQLDGWQRGARLPVRVLLAQAVAVPTGDPLEAIWSSVPELNQQNLSNDERLLLRDTLAHTLERGQGLMLIDGLEQISAGDALERAGALINAARRHYGASFILITYRSEDYTCPVYKLNEVESAVLAPLDPREIELFIRRWYNAFATQGRYRPEDALARARSLCALLRSQPHLQAFASTPQHLATMVIVHADQGELPASVVKSFWLALAR